MNVPHRFAFAALLVGSATGARAVAQEKTIHRAELPPAVEHTVAEQSKGATIQGFSTDVEGGQRIYEVALTVNGHARAISIDRRGNLLEVEDEVAMASLPQVVKVALAKAAGAGTIEKVETLTTF